MCGWEGYTVKNYISIKFKMADLRQLLTLLCVITGKLCHTARPLGPTIEQNVRFQVGIYCEKFIMRNNCKDVSDRYTINIEQDVQFQVGIYC